MCHLAIVVDNTMIPKPAQEMLADAVFSCSKPLWLLYEGNVEMALWWARFACLQVQIAATLFDVHTQPVAED